MNTSSNPQAEADAVLGDGYVGRVHEPSPPALTDDFFADDPLATDVGAGTVVASIGGDQTWADYISEHPDLSEWAAERWLIGASLAELPADLVETRTALHRLAIYVVAAARHQANGKFGLRWTRGGFGTPFFGNDKQVRVDGDRIIVQEAGQSSDAQITTLREVAQFIGAEIDVVAAEEDSPGLGDVDERLSVGADAALAIGNWFGLGVAALERVRGDEASVDPSRIQLWPGHFDPAMELGDEARRTSYGVSPGDHGSDEPYLYVAPWSPDGLNLDTNDPYWNASSYPGAQLSYSSVIASEDPLGDAVAFFEAGRDRIELATPDAPSPTIG